MGRRPTDDPKRPLTLSLRSSTIESLAARGAQKDPVMSAAQWLADQVEGQMADRPPAPKSDAGPAKQPTRPKSGSLSRREVEPHFKHRDAPKK